VEFELINDAEQYSLITLCLSYVIMMMYATFYFNNSEIPESLFLLTTLSILLINVAYICYWARNYYIYYFSKKMRTFVQALRDTIRKDGVVWLERLQKEHHIIFKIHNYFFKKQYLLGDINDQTQEFNAFFSESDKNELGLTSLYAKLLAKTYKSSIENKEENRALLEMNNDLFEVKGNRTKGAESMWNDSNALRLRLNKTNLRAALIGEEVVLYESSLGRFKIIYKKILKGRNYYTYQMINEIRVEGEIDAEISDFYVEEKKSKIIFFLYGKNLFKKNFFLDVSAIVEASPPNKNEDDSNNISVHKFAVRIKSFTNEHDYLTFCLRIK